MATQTPKLGLPFIVAEQSSQEVTHNRALSFLDSGSNLALPSIASPTNTPPGSPADGDCYLIGASPTGAWASNANHVAIFVAGAGWYYVIPFNGLQAYALDTDKLHIYHGGWRSGVAF